MKIITLTVTTDGSGDGVTSHTDHVQGFLYAVQLVDGDFADGVDLDLDCVGPDDLTTILQDIDDFNTDQLLYSRTLEHLNTDGTALTSHTLPLVYGVPRATISSGGAAATGKIRLFVVDWF